MRHASPPSDPMQAPLLAGPAAPGRDLRLDFFRGLALIFIFVDHVPGNVFGHFTLRNFGFVDAAEVFVFVAGYAATLAYTKVFVRQGFAAGSLRVGKRLWQIYAAHILLLVVCVGGIGLAARALENPVYYEFINLVPFAYEPLEAILRALALNHHLVYLNILPLYIAPLAWFPALHWLLRRHPLLALAAALALWGMANIWGVDLPSYPNEDGWFFNPFAWQLLFTCGALAAHWFGPGGTRRLPRARWLVALAAAYAVFALVVIAPWTKLPGLEAWRLVPGDLLAPMAKSTLSPWRLAHILALAYLVAVFVGPAGAWYRQGWARGIVECGRNSLDIFALGTILSFFSLFVLVEMGRGFGIQVLLNLGGIVSMILVARWLSRKKAQATPNTIPALAPAVAPAASPAAPRYPAS